MRVHMGALVPIVPLQLCNCSFLLPGSCILSCLASCACLFLSDEACWLLPTAVPEGTHEEGCIADVGLGFFFEALFLTVSPLLST